MKRSCTTTLDHTARATVGCSRLLAIRLLFEEIRRLYVLKYSRAYVHDIGSCVKVFFAFFREHLSGVLCQQRLSYEGKHEHHERPPHRTEANVHNTSIMVCAGRRISRFMSCKLLVRLAHRPFSCVLASAHCLTARRRFAVIFSRTHRHEKEAFLPKDGYPA